MHVEKGREMIKNQQQIQKAKEDQEHQPHILC